MRPSLLKWLAAEIIAVLLIGAYILIDASDIYRWWVGDTKFVLATNTACDLHASECEAKLNDGTLITFDISPDDIPLMKPLHFKVTSTQEFSSVELKMFATNMNMGFHTVVLKKTAPNTYEGEGMLPTCVVGNMIWQANVIFNTLNQSQGAIFYFQTDK